MAKDGDYGLLLGVRSVSSHILRCMAGSQLERGDRLRIPIWDRAGAFVSWYNYPPNSPR